MTAQTSMRQTYVKFRNFVRRVLGLKAGGVLESCF